MFPRSWRVLRALCAGLFLSSLALAEFDDSRDFAKSKAKSSIKAVRKSFTKWDEEIAKNGRKLKDMKSWEKEVEKIEKQFAKIEDKDAEWDLGPERAYLEALGPRVEAAVEAYGKAKAAEDFEKQYAKLEKDFDKGKKITDVEFWKGAVDKVAEKLEKLIEETDGFTGDEQLAKLDAFSKKVAEARVVELQRLLVDNEPALDGWQVAPAPGVEAATGGAPGWCDAGDFQAEDRRMRGGGSYGLLADGLYEGDLLAMAHHACRAPDFEVRQEWARNWKQAVANRTGFTAARTDAFFRWVMTLPSEQRAMDERTTCAAFEDGDRRGAPSRPDSPDVAARKKLDAHGLGCEGWTMGGGDRPYLNEVHWWIDGAAQAPTQLQRAVLVLSQIGTVVSESDRRAGADEGDEALKRVGEFALASVDAQALDPAKFEAELKSAGYNAWGEWNARITFGRARRITQRYLEAYKKAGGEYLELAVEAPRRGAGKWRAAARQAQAGLAHGQKIEQAYLDGKPAGFRGTFGPAWKAFEAQARAEVKKAGATSEEDVAANFFGPIGYPLGAALTVAGSYEDRLQLTAIYYNRLTKNRTWRGPRWAAMWEAIDAYGKIKEADPNFPLEENRVARIPRKPHPDWTYAAYERTFNKTGGQDEESVVETVTPKGDWVQVSFITKKWMQKTYDCVETNKIDYISSDGRIVYRRRCTEKGEEPRSSTMQPIRIRTELAGGIRPGCLVKANVRFIPERDAVPLTVFDSPQKGKLLNYLGVTLD